MELPGERRYPKELWDSKGANWRIKFVNDLGEYRGRTTAGICDPNTQCIKIKRGMVREDVFLTFFHELIHCAEYAGNFRLEHKQVDKLETHLGGLIIANWGEFRDLFS